MHLLIKYFIPFVVSLLISFGLYGGTIGGKFVYDDIQFTNREDLKIIDSLWNVWGQSYVPRNVLSGNYRPFTVFTYVVQFLIFGENPAAFRTVNIILNGLVTFLVYCIVRQIWKNQQLAWICLVLFAVLPVHTEVVALSKSRDELLASFWMLTAWVVFQISLTKKRKQQIWFLGSSIAFFFSVLSKETYIPIPFVFFVTAFIQQRMTVKKGMQIALPFLVLGTVYVLLRIYVLGNYAFGHAIEYQSTNPLPFVSLSVRLYTSLHILFLYIGKTFFPIGDFRLSATHYYNAVPVVTSIFESLLMYGGIIVLGAFSWFSFAKQFNGSPIGIGAILFLVSYSLVSKFLFPYGDYIAERWIYFPSIGLVYIAGESILRISINNKQAGIWLLVILCSLYAMGTIKRSSIWISNESLYQSMIVDAPTSFQGYFGLASVFVDSGRLSSAKELLSKASEINPNYPPILDLYGVIALTENRYEVAEQLFFQAISHDHQLGSSYTHLLRLYYATKRYKDAEIMGKQVLTYSTPPKIEDMVVYALSFVKLHKFDDSLTVLLPLSKKYPNNLKVRYGLALTYYKKGDFQSAKKYFDWDSRLTQEEKLFQLTQD